MRRGPVLTFCVRTGLVSAILALHVWLAISATINLGVTSDETVHLTGGYSYWIFDDYRLHPENGNLPQRWAALPLLILRPRLELAAFPEDWKAADAWKMGHHFFFESGNNLDFVLLCARSTMLAWSTATGLLIFAWSRRLWGDIGGIFSLTLFAFSPTMLAHSPLVTSDMCAAFWLLAATAAWWRLGDLLTFRRLGLSVLTTSLAIVAKFSGLLLFPIMIAIVLWRTIRRSPVQPAARQARPLHSWMTSSFRAWAIGWIALMTIHVGVAGLVVWAFFGFRFSAFNNALPAGHFFSDPGATMHSIATGHWSIAVLRKLHALPDAFTYGLSYVLFAAQKRPAFAAGQFSESGWWWFFPFAFLVKSSIAELITVLVAVGTGISVWAKQRTTNVLRHLDRLAPLVCLAVVYSLFSVSSHLNIGQRHLLPLYPVLFIAAGGLCTPFTGLLGRCAAIAIAAIGGLECAHISPDYLAFFNTLAGGPQSGWRLLVDSSLDWGQNLPRLAKELSKRGAKSEAVYLSYFGSDDPSYHGIKAIELASYDRFPSSLAQFQLKGGLYCVTATMLQDVYSPYRGTWTLQREQQYRFLTNAVQQAGQKTESALYFKGDGSQTDLLLWNLERARFSRLCQYLRVKQPEAIIGHSIFIFRLDEREIHAAVRGTLGELAEAIDAALQRKSAIN